MLNPTTNLAEQLGEHLASTYTKYFSHRRADYASYLGGAASLVLERISNSNALYHNVEHTVMVVLVGQQILRGRLLSHSITPEDWLHYLCALLVHDIGYVRGVCPGDTETEVVTDETGGRVTLARGASDAVLAPYHVDRAKIYARERFGSSSFVDADRICGCIEMTRFPPPDAVPFEETATEGGLVRAADLIGQMGDPFYHRKIVALFYEMQETGMAATLGCRNPADLAETYPDFFRTQVEPLIQPALGYLSLTIEGKQWIANLERNVHHADRALRHAGTLPGGNGTPA